MGDWSVLWVKLIKQSTTILKAGQYPRAIEAVIESKQWNKAVNIVEGLDYHEVARSITRRLVNIMRNFEFGECREILC